MAGSKPSRVGASFTIAATISAVRRSVIGSFLTSLIGADLTNLDKVRGLGAPVASIGGVGHKQTLERARAISALLPKADIS